MKDIIKILEKAIINCLDNDKDDIAKNLCSKIYKEDTIERLIRNEKDYIIFGNGVLKKEFIPQLTNSSELDEVEENFYIISNQKELDDFKDILHNIQEIEKINSDTEDTVLRENIAKIVTNTDIHEEIFNILKSSKDLDSEDLLKKMDQVYVLVNKKATLDDLFNLIHKINKNFYVVNNRSEEIKKLKKLNGGNENGK